MNNKTLYNQWIVEINPDFRRPADKVLSLKRELFLAIQQRAI